MTDDAKIKAIAHEVMNHTAAGRLAHNEVVGVVRKVLELAQKSEDKIVLANARAL